MPRHDYSFTKKYRLERRAQGKCSTCGKPSARYRCPTCTAKKDRNWKRVRDKIVGRCLHCLRPLPEHRLGKKTCGWCQVERLDKRGW